MEHPRSTRAVAALALAATALAAACGGSSSDSGASNPSSNKYDPAKTTLKAAGLEVCSEGSSGNPANPSQQSAPITTRSFFVASDCGGSKTSPNSVLVMQYASKDARDAAVPGVKAAYPKGEVQPAGPLIIVTTG